MIRPNTFTLLTLICALVAVGAWGVVGWGLAATKMATAIAAPAGLPTQTGDATFGVWWQMDSAARRA